MKTARLSVLLRIAAPTLLAASIALPLPSAHAGILWVDNAFESIAMPLESPALGLARAKHLLDAGSNSRAEAALKRVIAKYPNATEAHALLARLYETQGKRELAALHAELAKSAG